MTSSRLTSLINKFLPNSYYNATMIASESQGASTYINCRNISVTLFDRRKAELEAKMKSSPYFDKYILINELDGIGQSIPDKGLYVFVYENKDEEIEAMTAKTTIGLQNVVNVQTELLKRKQELLEYAKELAELKKV